MSKLDKLMEEINKEFKGDIIRKGVSSYDYERIPFTSPRLNYMTFGGIPMGKLIEFYGENHGGKTSTSLDIVANYQNMEGARAVLYVDAENTLDVVWATKLGVDVDNMLIMNPTSQGAETIFEKVLQFIDTGDVGLVVIDSLGVLISNKALDESVEQKNYGGISMALTNFSKKAEMLCHKYNCTLIGINQIRDDMNSMYGGTTTTGGKAWKHNCFSGNTLFVTDKGLRRFRDCKEGEEVTVVDKDGNLRAATVHCYGVQRMQRVVLHTPSMKYEVICTPNHRWLLEDGSITEQLKVGDKLYNRDENIDHPITTVRQAEMFCMGMAIADGCDYQNKKSRGVRVVLCGNKAKYSSIFEKAHYRRSLQNGYVGYTKLHISKQNFLNGECWKYLSAEDNRYLFMGYYAGDGASSANKSCVTVDERVLNFIKYTCNLCGYYITSVRQFVGGGYTGNTSFYRVGFTTHSNKYNGWVVESIKPIYDSNCVYCVDEPITHTFTLEKGIVTGNCSMRVEFRQGKYIDSKYKELSRGAENPFGQKIMVAMTKNKTCPPTRHTGYYTLRFDSGIDYLYDLSELCLKYGILEQGGAWYSIINIDTNEPIAKLQGIASVYDYLNEHIDVLQQVEAWVNQKMQEA